jgi:hypothetical protein
VVDGRHLLVADDPHAMVSRCVDPAPGRRAPPVTDVAYRVFWERYRWDAIAPTVVEIATRVAGGNPSFGHAMLDRMGSEGA